MKRPTVFLGEMTDPEVEAFLEVGNRTVLVPTGSTEQHGPHGPLLTDMLVAQEVARRVAPRIGAVVAPAINYALSYPHVGFAVVHIRVATFMALIEDLCASLGSIGFERIVFLNGHYDNTYAIAYACASAAERMKAGVRAFPVNYWDGMTEAEREMYLGQAAGLHANAGETSAVLAIDPGLVDMDRANAEFPPFPETSSPAPVHTAFFFSAPGSMHRATQSGTWGDARGATAEIGERYLEAGVESTVRVLDDIERTFAAMPER